MRESGPIWHLHNHEADARADATVSDAADPGDAALTAPFGESAAAEARAFHARIPEYGPTPLHALTGLAADLGLGAVWLKDETGRFGLGAFKGLGASYAIHRVIGGGGESPTTFTTATDGNHGRAVAWAARREGHAAVVFLPGDAAAARERSIAAAGAETRRVDGTYDDAVEAASRAARERGWTLLQDTSFPGYEEIPGWVMQGYVTLVDEAVEQLEGRRPTHVLLQCGVGSFAAAVAAHLAARFGEDRPRVLLVEPQRAACGLAALRAGAAAPPRIEGDLHTLMACLSCGQLSLRAWALLRRIADDFLACSDEVAADGMRRLVRPRGGDPAVIAGESGAATTGALAAICRGARAGLRGQLGLGSEARVLLVCTEGANDPDAYRRIVGREAATAAGVRA